MADLKSKIWAKQISAEELEATKQAHNVIYTNFNEDNSMRVRVLSDTKPDDSFKEAEPILEDVYFTTLQSVN